MEHKSSFPIYNIELMTYIKGKNICNNCMDAYNKIEALMGNYDFVCDGIQYYADGRNLE